ncbi:Hsp70 family protein, partial [Methanomethylovorans sp. PtaU1.Bin093]
GDSVTADQKSKVESAISDLKDALQKDDIETIKSRTEALQTAIYDVSAAMYQKAQQEAASGAGASAKSGSGDDTVEDADYEIVDDGKN